MSKKDLYISLALNFINFVAVIICTIFTFKDGVSELRMFTVQSNIMCGIVAGIMTVFEILILLKRKEKLPKWLLTLKMVINTSVFLTFMVVALFLGFVAIAEGYSYFILFRGTNIFFHFLTPVIAVVSFTFFEKTNEIKFKYTFFNLIHMGLYTIFYVLNVKLELTFNEAIGRYDWYYFFATGNDFISSLIIIAGLGVTYGLGFLMWYFNKKLYNRANLLTNE